ncbi:hypothetical protein ACFY12_34130 [Streptomyces sp. NPDC001339]|uniref:hypothetical protein n=1 Tax=Streptomyces sp. NPDC001339 TaxID=3364563 RepID=UPI00368BA828
MTASNASRDRIQKIYDSHRGLYAPSLVTEAAAFLDDLLDTAEKHGHDRTDQSQGLSWLVMAAAEATSSKYRSHRNKRTYEEVNQLTRALSTELTKLGLTITGARNGVGAEPVAGGPTWGLDGRTGLAVSIYTDGGWDLTVNQQVGAGSVHSIYAPHTAEGAKEVAAIVHGILHGEIADPFRRRT